MTAHETQEFLAQDRRLPVKVSAGIATAAIALVAAVPAISGAIPGFISVPANLPFVGHKHHHRRAPDKPEADAAQATAVPLPEAAPAEAEQDGSSDQSEPTPTKSPRSRHRRSDTRNQPPHVIGHVRQPHSRPAPRPAPERPRHADSNGGTRAPSYERQATAPEPTYQPKTAPQPTYQPTSAPAPTQATDGDSTTQPPPSDGRKHDGGD